MHLEIAALQLVAFGYVFMRCAFSVFDLFGVNGLIGGRGKKWVRFCRDVHVVGGWLEVDSMRQTKPS